MRLPKHDTGQILNSHISSTNQCHSARIFFKSFSYSKEERESVYVQTFTTNSIPELSVLSTRLLISSYRLRMYRLCILTVTSNQSKNQSK